MQNYGWVLSKPYGLRIFDGWVKESATFSDYAGVLRMMTASGQAAGVLLRCCTMEEVEAVMQSTCESLLLDLLKKALKTESRMHKPLADDESLLAGIEAFEANVHQDWFMPKSFQYSVEVVRDLVRCKTLDVLALKKRLRELGEYIEKTGEATGDLIVEYVVGPGKRYYDEAVCCMQARAGEAKSQELVLDLISRGEELLALPEWGADGLEEVAAWHEQVQKVLSRKRKRKKGSVITTTHSQKLSTYAGHVVQETSEGVGKVLSASFGWALKMCYDALSRDGYDYYGHVDEDDADPSQNGLIGGCP